MLQNQTERLPYRFITPVLQHIQLPLDHRLDNANTSFENTAAQIIAVVTQSSERRNYSFLHFKNPATELTSELTAQTHLKYVGDNISFTELKERIFVEGRVHL